jgi:hypothetical protein
VARPLLVWIVLVALAGCAGPINACSATDPIPADQAPGRCHVGLTGVPSEVRAGQSFSFDVTPMCPYPWSSDHVGASFRLPTPGNPAPSPCPEHSDSSNDTVHAQSTCVIPDGGTYRVQGHVSLGPDATLYSRECEVRVAD